MASPAALGFVQGFAETRGKMIDKEQEKQDKLKERMQEMAIKGMEKRYEQHQTRKAAMSNIKALVSAGKTDQATMAYDQLMGGAAGAKALGAKGMSDFEGVDKKMLGLRSEQQRKYLEAQIKAFESMKEPELDMDSINNIQVQRGVDNMSLEGWLRERVGLKGEDVPTANSYAGLFATSTPLPQDTTVKSGTSYVDAPAKAGENTRLDIYDRINPESGVKERASRVVDKHTGQALSKERVYEGEKAPAKQVKAMTKGEIAAVELSLATELERMQSVGGAEEKLADKLEDALGDAESPGTLFPAYTNEIERIRRMTAATPVEAAEAALDHMKLMYKAGLIQESKDGGWFGTGLMTDDISSIDQVVKRKEQLKPMLQKAVKEGRITKQEGLMLKKRYVDNVK